MSCLARAVIGTLTRKLGGLAIAISFAVVVSLAGEARPTGALTALWLSLDCDTVTNGVQSTCTSPMGTRLVNVVLVNNSASPVSVGSLNFVVFDPATTRLNPPPINNPGSLDDNPDLNNVGVPGLICTPPDPDNDLGSGGPGTATSFLSCFTGAANGPTIPAGGSLVLATVHYDVVGFGPTTLSLQNVAISNNALSEIGSCSPTIDVAMDCNSTTITSLCTTPFNFDTVNCFSTTGLWHRELPASISGMTGDMLAFNTGCTGPQVIGCTYNTGLQVTGSATSPTFGAFTGGTLRFKSARDTEDPECFTGFDKTTVEYSTNSGGSFSALDLSVGTITAGGQTLGSGALAGQVCGQSLTAQTISVAMPAGTTTIRFTFDSVDEVDNGLAGWFIDDVSMAIDADGDGCSDIEEAGPTASLGGQRNPDFIWDFYDVNGSKKVDATDIGLVRSKFLLVTGAPAYGTQYDRSPGANPWAPGQPNGLINAVDIGLVRGEFLHNCQAAPN